MTARSVRYAVCEAMGSAIPEGFRPQPPARPTSAAGADVAEGVAVDGVAADPAVFDTGAAPSYRDRVEHRERLTEQDRCGGCGRYDSECVCAEHEPNDWHRPDGVSRERERERRARLSRWQETRG